MKVYFIKVLLTISTIQYISGATDYCKLCSNHIACNHTTNFISECPDNAVIVDLSQSDKDFFVNVHNELRSNIAGGMIPGFSSAANMSAVVWDPELAYFAELNVMQCKMSHDGCRKTENYWLAGQNLWSRSGTYSQYPAINATIQRSVMSWFNEYKTANQTQMDTCCQGSLHFTQVIQYRVVAIGCALARYGYKWKIDLIACNYSFGNRVKYPVYISGPPASSCKNGKHEVYANLCK